MKYSETIILIKRIIGLHVFVMLTIIIQSTSIIAQTKQETINWLNLYGESYLKELSNPGSIVKSLTVNSDGYVVIELEETGSYSERGFFYIKRYTFEFNDLDPSKVEIWKNPFNAYTSSAIHVRISCQLDNKCIRQIGNHRGETDLINSPTSGFSIRLNSEADSIKINRLINAFKNSIEIFGGKSVSVDEKLFDGN